MSLAHSQSNASSRTSSSDAAVPRSGARVVQLSRAPHVELAVGVGLVLVDPVEDGFVVPDLLGGTSHKMIDVGR